MIIVKHTIFADKFSALIAQFSARKRLIIVRNKIDITADIPAVIQQDDAISVLISAKTGVGIELLQQTILDAVGYHTTQEGTFSARRRHLLALESAAKHLQIGTAQLSDYRAGELLAEELRLAQNALSEITGEFRADDLLGKIFSSFCIGH